jgi:phosphatidylinositol-3-phosphatase
MTRGRRPSGWARVVLGSTFLVAGLLWASGVPSTGRTAPASASVGVSQSFGAKNAKGSATLSASPSAATTAGDLLVALIRDRNTSALAPVSSVTDTAGNHWVRDVSVTRGSHVDGEIWSVGNAASIASSQTITVTVGGASAATSAIAFSVLDVTGASASALDATATNSGTTQPASTGTTATTAQASEIAIGDIGWNFSVTPSGQTAGYTTTAIEQSTVSGSAAGEQAAWQLLTATGPRSYSATLSPSSVAWTGAIATFRVGAPASSISGTVTDSVTQAPISGATVSYSGGSTTTNGSGGYTMTNVAPGTYTVTASATGYTSQSAQVSVTAGMTTTQSFTLVPPPGRITGTVTDSVTTAAISSATISYGGADGSGSTTTGTDGTYTLDMVPEGSYTVSVSAPGYTTQSAPVSVAPGATTTQDFALVAQPGTITGTVTDSVTSSAIAGATVSFGGAGPPPPTPHVMVVMLENAGYPATLGSCTVDPYLCSLANSYASATNWYGVRHPSLPNYLAATTGSTQACTSDGCLGPYAPSLGGQLNSAGIPWVAWLESMPSACATSGTKAYDRAHNPFSYESDINCAAQDVPYPGVSGAVNVLSGSSAPAFVWLGPDETHNMHPPATVAAGDAWLNANIAPILASPWYTNGNATVIITMDEFTGDKTNGGGHVPMVVISNAASGKGAFAATGNHYGTVRTVEEAYGLGYLGAASDPANGDLHALFGVGNSITTNGSGGYTMTNVAPGTYTVTASATGHTSQSAQVSVTAGGTTTQNFVLVP